MLNPEIEVLLDKIWEGETVAYEELYIKYAKNYFENTCSKLTDNKSEQEDAVSLANSTLWDKLNCKNCHRLLCSIADRSSCKKCNGLTPQKCKREQCTKTLTFYTNRLWIARKSCETIRKQRQDKMGIQVGSLDAPDPNGELPQFSDDRIPDVNDAPEKTRLIDDLRPYLSKQARQEGELDSVDFRIMHLRIFCELDFEQIGKRVGKKTEYCTSRYNEGIKQILFQYFIDRALRMERSKWKLRDYRIFQLRMLEGQGYPSEDNRPVKVKERFDDRWKATIEPELIRIDFMEYVTRHGQSQFDLTNDMIKELMGRSPLILELNEDSTLKLLVDNRISGLEYEDALDLINEDLRKKAPEALRITVSEALRIRVSEAERLMKAGVLDGNNEAAPIIVDHTVDTLKNLWYRKIAPAIQKDLEERYKIG